MNDRTDAAFSGDSEVRLLASLPSTVLEWLVRQDREHFALRQALLQVLLQEGGLNHTQLAAIERAGGPRCIAPARVPPG